MQRAIGDPLQVATKMHCTHAYKVARMPWLERRATARAPARGDHIRVKCQRSSQVSPPILQLQPQLHHTHTQLTSHVENNDIETQQNGVLTRRIHTHVIDPIEHTRTA